MLQFTNCCDNVTNLSGNSNLTIFNDGYNWHKGNGFCVTNNLPDCVHEYIFSFSSCRRVWRKCAEEATSGQFVRLHTWMSSTHTFLSRHELQREKSRVPIVGKGIKCVDYTVCFKYGTEFTHKGLTVCFILFILD